MCTLLDIKCQQSLLRASKAWLKLWKDRGRLFCPNHSKGAEQQSLHPVQGIGMLQTAPWEANSKFFSHSFKASFCTTMVVNVRCNSTYLLRGFLVTELYIYSLLHWFLNIIITPGLQISEIEVSEHLCNLSICVPLIKLISQARYWSSSPYMKYHRAFLDSYCFCGPQSFHGP